MAENRVWLCRAEGSPCLFFPDSRSVLALSRDVLRAFFEDKFFFGRWIPEHRPRCAHPTLEQIVAVREGQELSVLQPESWARVLRIWLEGAVLEEAILAASFCAPAPAPSTLLESR